MNIKRSIFIIVGILSGVSVLVIFVTGGEIFGRWSVFLSDCDKIKVGDSLAQYELQMKKYIDDPRYNYMTNTYGPTTTISLADDKSFHLKTWRCVVEIRENVIAFVNASN